MMRSESVPFTQSDSTLAMGRLNMPDPSNVKNADADQSAANQYRRIGPWLKIRL